MNGSSNRVRLSVVDRKVDTGSDLLLEHGFADEEWVGREVEPYLSSRLGRRCIEACKGRSTHRQDDEWLRWAAGFGHQ